MYLGWKKKKMCTALLPSRLKWVVFPRHSHRFGVCVHRSRWRGVKRNQTAALSQLTFIFPEADLAAERVDLFTGSLSPGCWGRKQSRGTQRAGVRIHYMARTPRLTVSGCVQTRLSSDPVELNCRLSGSALWPLNYQRDMSAAKRPQSETNLGAGSGDGRPFSSCCWSKVEPRMSFHPQAQAAVEEIQTLRACKKNTNGARIW